MTQEGTKKQFFVALSSVFLPLIVCIIPSILIFAYGARGFVTEYLTLYWPTTEGRVISSKISMYLSSERMYEPIVSYEYSVLGKKYSSNQFSLHSVSDKNRDIIQEVINQYPPGKTIQVYYAPSNPEVSLLSPGPDWTGVMVFSLISSLCFAWGCLWGMGELRDTKIVTNHIFVRGMSIFMAVPIVIFGTSGILWLNNNCITLPQNQCKILWGTMFASLLGTIVLIEVVIARKKAKGEWGTTKYDDSEVGTEPKSNTISRAFFISSSRFILVGILGILPFIITGGFLSVFSGIALGIGIDFLLRGIMGWLPPAINEV